MVCYRNRSYALCFKNKAELLFLRDTLPLRYHTLSSHSRSRRRTRWQRRSTLDKHRTYNDTALGNCQNDYRNGAGILFFGIRG